MNQPNIDRYLSGRMGETESQAFEEYCLNHPEFARQVEFEQRLKAGIAQVARHNTQEFVRAEPRRSWLGIAAALVLTLLGGLLAWHFVQPTERPPALAAVVPGSEPTGTLMRLALVRGESTPLLPEGLVRVAIAGLFDPGFEYSIALDRLDVGRNIDTIATLNGQHPTSPVTLEVLVDSDQLAVGTYSLRVRKQVPGEEALDFEFLKR